MSFLTPNAKLYIAVALPVLKFRSSESRKVQQKAHSLGMKGGWEEDKVKSQVAPGRKVRRNSVHTGTKYCSVWRLRPSSMKLLLVAQKDA